MLALHAVLFDCSDVLSAATFATLVIRLMRQNRRNMKR